MKIVNLRQNERKKIIQIYRRFSHLILHLILHLFSSQKLSTFHFCCGKIRARGPEALIYGRLPGIEIATVSNRKGEASEAELFTDRHKIFHDFPYCYGKKNAKKTVLNKPS